MSIKQTLGDADLSVYKGSIESITETSRVLRKSEHARGKTDAVTIRNASRRSTSAYVDVSPHRNIKTARYIITIKRR